MLHWLLFLNTIQEYCRHKLYMNINLTIRNKKTDYYNRTETIFFRLFLSCRIFVVSIIKNSTTNQLPVKTVSIFLQILQCIFSNRIKENYIILLSIEQ